MASIPSLATKQPSVKESIASIHHQSNSAAATIYTARRSRKTPTPQEATFFYPPQHGLQESRDFGRQAVVTQLPLSMGRNLARLSQISRKVQCVLNNRTQEIGDFTQRPEHNIPTALVRQIGCHLNTFDHAVFAHHPFARDVKCRSMID